MGKKQVDKWAARGTGAYRHNLGKRAAKKAGQTDLHTGQVDVMGEAARYKMGPEKFRRGAAVVGAMQHAGDVAGKAGRMAGWAFHNPLIATGGALAITGMGGQLMDVGEVVSPMLTGAKADTNYNRQAAAASNMQMGMISPTGGITSGATGRDQYMQAFQQSTQGMVQGLHRGRHG